MFLYIGQPKMDDIKSYIHILNQNIYIVYALCIHRIYQIDQCTERKPFPNHVREAAKKVFFLVARLLRPLAPPPLGLVAIGTFFFTLKKVIFSLVAHPFSPLPPS